MNIKTIVKNDKKIITRFLNLYLSRSELDRSDIKKLKNYLSEGKMVRGALFLLIAEGYGYKKIKDILPIAAALEISHAGLLIHDDIIDNDTLRRGKSALHILYADEINMFNPAEYGKSRAMIIGDMCFFMMFDMLAQTSIDRKLLQSVVKISSQEMTNVCRGQMIDHAHSSINYEPSQKEILETYRLKTARYSTALPLLLGGFVGKASKGDMQLLDRLGDSIGLLYQISDDSLNIFGKSDVTGKSIGSDISDNKKTLYRYLLLKKAKHNDLKIVQSIFHKSNINVTDLNNIKRIIKKYDIDKSIDRRMKKLEKESCEITACLKIEDHYKKLLYELIDFIITRKT